MHPEKQLDLVAQLVEHITFNDGVLGSSPSQVTKKVKHFMFDFFNLWPRGEIGRLATLRWWCRKTCQFESGRGHEVLIYMVNY